MISSRCVGKKINVPFKSNRKFKKFDVCVKNKRGNVVKLSYGDSRFEDYTIHKDKERRRRFRLRHSCDPVSKLDKIKPKYWTCQKLWKN